MRLDEETDSVGEQIIYNPSAIGFQHLADGLILSELPDMDYKINWLSVKMVINVKM